MRRSPNSTATPRSSRKPPATIRRDAHGVTTASRATAADNYWSSTTNAGNSSNAWNVNFNDGNVNNDDKNNSLRVRAVRGGW